MNHFLGHLILLLELQLRGVPPLEMIILCVDQSTWIVHRRLLEVLLVDHLFMRKKAMADAWRDQVTGMAKAVITVLFLVPSALILQWSVIFIRYCSSFIFFLMFIFSAHFSYCYKFMYVVRMTFILGMLRLWVDNQEHAMTMMGVVLLPYSMVKVITTATSLQGL